jgi:hypothetical protein
VRQARVPHEAPQQIVGEELEEEHRVIGDEALAGGLADGPGLLSSAMSGSMLARPLYSMGRLDVGRVDGRVVGQEDLRGPVDAVPERGLPPAGVLARNWLQTWMPSAT